MLSSPLHSLGTRERIKKYRDKYTLFQAPKRRQMRDPTPKQFMYMSLLDIICTLPPNPLPTNLNMNHWVYIHSEPLLLKVNAGCLVRKPANLINFFTTATCRVSCKNATAPTRRMPFIISLICILSFLFKNHFMIAFSSLHILN